PLLLAVAANAKLGAVVVVVHADPDTAAARLAEQQHVGDVDGRFLGQPPAARVLLARLEVLVHQVDAFDQDLALLGENAEDAAGPAILGVLADDHFHQVFFANVHGLTRLDHLGGQADDLQETAVAQLAGHGPEDAGAARVLLVVDQDDGVAVEADVTAVLAP